MSIVHSIYVSHGGQRRFSGQLLPVSRNRPTFIFRSLLLLTTTLVSGLTMVSGSHLLLKVPQYLQSSVSESPGQSSKFDIAAVPYEPPADSQCTSMSHNKLLFDGDSQQGLTVIPESFSDEHRPSRIQVDMAALSPFSLYTDSDAKGSNSQAVSDLLGYNPNERRAKPEPSIETVQQVQDYFGRDIDLGSRNLSRYDNFFRKYTALFFGADVDWRWFKAQAYVESRLKHRAESHKGAIGIMQIMPATYAEIQRKNSFFAGKSIYEPEWNIAAGIYYNAYLKRIWRKKSQQDLHFSLMFASYNAGIGRVSSITTENPQAREVELNHSRLPGETRRYLRKISVLMDRYTGTSLILPSSV